MHQKEITSKEADIFKIQKEKLQTSLEWLNGRFVLAEKRISDFEDRLIEIMQAEKQEKKELKKVKTISEKCGTSLSTPVYT